MAITIPSTDTIANYKTLDSLYFVGYFIRETEIDVGDYLILCISADADVIPSNVRIYDEGAPGTYYVDLGAPTEATTATNSGNTVASIRYIKVTSMPGGNDTISVRAEGLSDSEAKAAILYIVRGLTSADPLDKTSSNVGSGTTHGAGPTATLSQADEIAIACIGTEHKYSEALGSWTTGAGYISGTQRANGTNANGSAANITIRSAAEIVSATTALEGEITSEDDCDWAACVATFKGAAGGIQVTPAQAEAQAACLSPVIVLGSTTATPAMANSEVSAEDPVTVLGSISITPALAETEASAEDPSAFEGPITLTPAYAESEAELVAPGIVLGSITFSPALAEALAAALDPDVQVSGGGVEVTPDFAEAVASALDPNVVLGSINITPGIAEALASLVDPAIVLGSIVLTPALAESEASALDPDVVLGSITLTPAIAEALASLVDPLVTGGGVSLTPDEVDALASLVDPEVLMSSITLTPAFAEFLGESLDPSVIITTPTGPNLRIVNLYWTFGVGKER